ncbi:Mth938-like domain-containing protein [Alphaproteobacteria bacterium]|nr:Mth938-like domain-containing protein [Alphaproteobacteria bacterium]
MHLEFENLQNEYFISSYGKNYVIIKENKYFNKLVLLGSTMDSCDDVNDIFSQEFFYKKINQHDKTEYNFLLFGTGKNAEKIPLKIYEFLVKSNIPYEVMKSVSAFKTYNILLSQGKKILAFLDLET